MSEWSESWEATCNIFEDSDGFTVQTALPGIEPSQIDVQVEHNVLRVKGERKSEMSEQTKWSRAVFQMASSRVHSSFLRMWTMKNPRPGIGMGL